MSIICKSDQDGRVILTEEDKKRLQEVAENLQSQLTEMESYKSVFESARHLVLRVSGANVGENVHVALEVHGSIKANPGLAHGGGPVCYRDPPGVCEPGPCDYLTD